MTIANNVNNENTKRNKRIENAIQMPRKSFPKNIYFFRSQILLRVITYQIVCYIFICVVINIYVQRRSKLQKLLLRNVNYMNYSFVVIDIKFSEFNLLT